MTRELLQQKKHLEDELAEISEAYEASKPVTPTGTIDWFVKWFAVIMAVVGVFTISAGFTFYGQVCYVLSSIAWIYVGMQWGDRAIMIGSAISGTAVMMSIMQTVQ